jgi:hypothetical protein
LGLHVGDVAAALRGHDPAVPQTVRATRKPWCSRQAEETKRVAGTGEFVIGSLFLLELPIP